MVDTGLEVGIANLVHFPSYDLHSHGAPAPCPISVIAAAGSVLIDPCTGKQAFNVTFDAAADNEKAFVFLILDNRQESISDEYPHDKTSLIGTVGMKGAA
jgi:hypothetical protein